MFNRLITKTVISVLLTFLTSTASFASLLPLPCPKPEITGLISMGDVSFLDAGTMPNNSIQDFYNFPGIFSGVVINVRWDQLQPTPDPNCIKTDVIEQYLAPVRAFNRAYPGAPLAVRLRVWSGSCAPAWVKNMGSGPVHVFNRGQDVTVGPFWTTGYAAAWTTLQNAIAARYDSDPLIHDVGNSLGCSKTDEPLNLPVDSKSVANLHAAGFSDAAYMSVLAHAPDSYAAWQTTHVEYPFTRYKLLDGKTPTYDDNVDYQLMQQFRQQLGSRAILSNHDLNYPLDSVFVPLYTYIKQLGGPISLQTLNRKVNWNGSIQYGSQTIGATAIELWVNGPSEPGWQSMSKATLQGWSNEIKRAAGQTTVHPILPPGTPPQ